MVDEDRKIESDSEYFSCVGVHVFPNVLSYLFNNKLSQ